MHFQTNLNVFVFYHVQVSSLHPYPMILAKYKETRGGLIIYTWTLALLSAQYCMCTTATKCCRESLDILLPQTLISFTPDALSYKLRTEEQACTPHPPCSCFVSFFSLLHCHTFSLPFLFHGGVAAPVKCLFEQVPPCSQIAATLLCSRSINMFYNTQTQDLQLWTFACLLFCNKADYSACDNLQIVNGCSHLSKFPKTSENANKEREMLFLMCTSSTVFGRILHRGQIPINAGCVYIA